MQAAEPRSASWIADYPDGDNFMQLLYGPNIVPEQQRLREDPRIRQALRADAADAAGRRSATSCTSEMARIIEAYAPWRLDDQPLPQQLVQPRVLGYKKHPILHARLAVHRRGAGDAK